MSSEKAEVFQKVAKKLGFQMVRQKGSHQRWVHNDGRATTIPVHPSTTIEPPLYNMIIKQLGISKDDFRKLK